jgi:hypothetical protein
LHGVRSGWLPVCSVNADVSARDGPGEIGNVISFSERGAGGFDICGDDDIIADVTLCTPLRPTQETE